MNWRGDHDIFWISEGLSRGRRMKICFIRRTKISGQKLPRDGSPLSTRPSSLFFSKEGIFFSGCLLPCFTRSVRHAVPCRRNPVRFILARLDSSSSSLIFLDLLIIMLTSLMCWTAWEHIFSLSFLWTPFLLSVLYPWLSETRPCPEILVLEPLFWCFSSWCIALTFNGAPFLIFPSPLPMIHLSSETQPSKTQTCFTPQNVLLFHLPISVTAALLSCSSTPAFLSFFSLESTTKSYWLFTYSLLNLFLLLQSHHHPQRISPCYLPPSLLNTAVIT